ncbi:hypothetical protein ACFQZ4_00090 [Catellatospora coxensis]
MPAREGRGQSSTRATSVPSARAATTNAASPRSTPTQPVPLSGWWRAASCRSAASQVSDTDQRPARWLTVADRTLALPLASIRRSRRVSSRTARVPIPGRVTVRGASPPTRIPARPVVEVLLRIRNDNCARFFDLNLGNPTRRPSRSPLRDAMYAASPRPRSTAASSNTCWHTSARHARPVVWTMVVPSAAATSTRPAAAVRFQVLNALIRSKPDHGTFPTVPRRLPSRACLTSRRHWL